MDDPLALLRDQAAEALFPVEGELRAPGLDAPVTVTRGPLGMPIIEAQTQHDLWFAQGMVTAGERLPQIDLALRAANGRLSEVFGALTLEVDRFVRLIGLHLAGAAMAARWDEADHAMHARFRDGVRAWMGVAPAPPLEYRMLGGAPKLPDDPASWGSCFAYLGWGLSNNYDLELLRARIRDHAGEETMRLLLPPESGRDARGSNAWAVAGDRTARGMPILANDPHLLALHPGAWIPMHLRAPGYDVRGVALSFAPGIVLGATTHHAWGATNVTGDVQDMFEVTDEDVTGVRVERITVLGEAEPHLLEVRETRHGPILDRVPVGVTASVHEDVERPLALRWTGMEHGLRPTTVLRIAQAEDVDAFRRAVAEVGCPGQNFVYADAEGHIAVQVTGAHPVRRHGDGTIPLPDHGWDGWIAPEDLPFLLDPPDGVIVSANDGLLAAPSDHLLSMDFHSPNRALRIRELLEATARHDVASTAAAQRDTVSLAARETVPLLLARVPAAARHLDGWDHDLAAGSIPAAIFQVWTEAIARRAIAPHLPEEVLRAYLASIETWRTAVLPSMLREGHPWLDDATLSEALDDALAELGDPIPPWGELHRLRLAHPLARIPGLEALFTAVDEPMGGDEQTVAAAGMDGVAGRTAAVIASVRMVWDLADPHAGVPVVASGVSGNVASPHWADQQPTYRDGTPHPAGGEETLTLTP